MSFAKELDKRLFWIDEKRKLFKTYRDLINDLNNKIKARYYIYFSNPYEVFLELIHSIIVKREVEMLDGTFTDVEIENLGIKYQKVFEEVQVEKVELNSIEELYLKIFSEKRRWRLAIYTSGTTGRPKKVWHSFETLTRNVRTGEKYADNVWAFAYNPTHMAGLQVFFQAFLNMNPMIYLFESDRKKVPELMKKYKITNISATPTFYRSVLPYFDAPLFSINRVTFGGEKYDPSLEEHLKRIFPNAKIVNIYASTEAGALFASHGEFFTIPENIKNLIKINEKGELLIHKELLGDSSDFKLEGEWYHTGDIVEKIDENSFKFLHRETELINVGGYKVNPNEVEEEIKKIRGVIDVRVYSKSNRITGNIIVADVVKEKDIDSEELESMILEYLNNTLQFWKVPRIINFVDSLELTRTGKKVRK